MNYKEQFNANLKDRQHTFRFLGDGRVEITQRGWSVDAFTLQELYDEFDKVAHMSNMGEISLDMASNRRYVLQRAIWMLEGEDE